MAVGSSCTKFAIADKEKVQTLTRTRDRGKIHMVLVLLLHGCRNEWLVLGADVTRLFKPFSGINAENWDLQIGVNDRLCRLASRKGTLSWKNGTFANGLTVNCIILFFTGRKEGNIVDVVVIPFHQTFQVLKSLRFISIFIHLGFAQPGSTKDCHETRGATPLFSATPLDHIIVSTTILTCLTALPSTTQSMNNIPYQNDDRLSKK